MTAALRRIRRLLRERTGVVLDAEKDYFIESRLMPILQRHGLPSTEAMVERLPEAPALEREAVEALLVTETQFCRDGVPFDLLRRGVVPALMERRASERALRLWCAASSSGQEPYSVAMLLRSSFPALAGWQVDLLASDVSEEMLERARAGIYTQHEVNRGLPVRFLIEHFERAGFDWRVKDEVRAAVEFQRVNLLQALPPLPRMDVVLLRNVLIYFDLPTKRAVLERVREVLRPDGFLLLGAAETTLFVHEGFEPVELAGGACYRLTEDAA